MPARLRAWYSLRDIESLAARNAVMSGNIPIENLERLSAALETTKGSVDFRLRFERRDAVWQKLRLEYSAALKLVCQRCLDPVAIELCDAIDFGVLATESLERSLPAGIEPLIVADERLSLLQLIEDELILALPLVPKHQDDRECRGSARLPKRQRSDDNKALEEARNATED